MKITVVTGPFLPIPPGPAGAVEKIWAKLSIDFADRGHEVTLVSKAQGLSRHAAMARVNCREVAGYSRSGRIMVDLARDLFYSIRAAKQIPRSDVTVTNTFWLPAVLTLARAQVGKMVVSVERYPKGQLRLYQGAARFRAPSRAVGDAIRREWPSARERTRVIPNPIDTTVFNPDSSSCRGKRDPSIIYTGRVHPEKGLHLLVEAFRRIRPEFPEYRLEIVGQADVRFGGGGEEYVRRLSAIADGSPVFFFPSVDDPAALAARLRRATVYCYPSVAEKGESFGVAALEAMATGLPCVLSGLECFQDFAEQGENSLVFDHRSADPPGGIANCLRRLLSDEPERARIGCAAAEGAKRFGFDNVAELMLADFEEICGQ